MIHVYTMQFSFYLLSVNVHVFPILQNCITGRNKALTLRGIRVTTCILHLITHILLLSKNRKKFGTSSSPFNTNISINLRKINWTETNINISSIIMLIRQKNHMMTLTKYLRLRCYPHKTMYMSSILFQLFQTFQKHKEIHVWSFCIISHDNRGT